MIKMLINFFKGLVFGIIQVVPGISSGTIALVLGFYFDLLNVINNFFGNIKKNLVFVIPLVAGMITGLIIFSSIIIYLLANHSFATMFFFMGLIAGSIPLVFFKVYEKGRKTDISLYFFAILPLAALVVMSLFKVENSAYFNAEEIYAAIDIQFMFMLFLAGILSAAALIIPGFSGSFVLLLVGVYNIIVYSASSLRFLLVDITNTSLLLNICKVLIPMGLGIIIGIIFMSRIIEKLLKNFPRQTYAVILGLIIGSIIVLFREPMVYASGISLPIVVAGIFTFLGGGFLSFITGKRGI